MAGSLVLPIHVMLSFMRKIPLEGRITAVADVFDALVSKRPYKHAWTVDEGFEYLNAQKGKHFDPRCVEAFMSAEERVREIQAQFADGQGVQ